MLFSFCYWESCAGVVPHMASTVVQYVTLFVHMRIQKAVEISTDQAQQICYRSKSHVLFGLPFVWISVNVLNGFFFHDRYLRFSFI